jgi:hypothetical protein
MTSPNGDRPLGFFMACNSQRAKKGGIVRGYRTVFGLLIAICLLTGHQAMAQSTLFNIPSTDAVAAKKVYAEFDFFAQMPTTSGSSRLYVYAPRAVVGAGAGIEAGVNVAMFHTTGFTQTYIQPNVKWRFAADDEKGIAASGGTILYTPANNTGTVDTFGLVYGNFSKKVKSGNYGPRFTGGVYGIYDADSAWAGPKAGAIAGYEQPIHPKVSIVADWFSGKNFFGYFTPGVSVTLPHSSLFNAGYSIGNDSYNGNHNRLLFLYYGITF